MLLPNASMTEALNLTMETFRETEKSVPIHCFQKRGIVNMQKNERPKNRDERSTYK